MHSTRHSFGQKSIKTCLNRAHQLRRIQMMRKHFLICVCQQRLGRSSSLHVNSPQTTRFSTGSNQPILCQSMFTKNFSVKFLVVLCKLCSLCETPLRCAGAVLLSVCCGFIFGTLHPPIFKNSNSTATFHLTKKFTFFGFCTGRNHSISKMALIVKLIS